MPEPVEADAVHGAVDAAVGDEVPTDAGDDAPVATEPPVPPEPPEPPVPPEPSAAPVRHRRRATDSADDHAPAAVHTQVHEAAHVRPPQIPWPSKPDLLSVQPDGASTTPGGSSTTPGGSSTTPGGGAADDRSAAPTESRPTSGYAHTRRVLVLGGSGTVGSAVVRALAAQGARVAVHHASRAAETDELIETLDGEGHLSVSADLADADAVGELVRFVDASFDGLDVVINAASAGDTIRHASIIDSTLSEWADAWTGTLTVDVLGAATTAHAAAAAFIARGQGGRIILLAARGRPFTGGRGSVTIATEQAVAALGSALALELAPYGVGVMVVGSGAAAASGWSPEALAETVAWLATGPASALTGATFNIAS
ncbi:NAD(P)-dependent dehydrogenase (short-subunit alcohol dehydrogenase family) [Nakamurella sp. UYEF19]